MADTAAIPQLTADYIKDHMIGVHTHESFGRAIAGGVLAQALEHARAGAVVNNEVKVLVEIIVRPTSARCVEVYTIHGWVHQTVHPVVD